MLIDPSSPKTIQTNKLNSLIGGSIRILNSTDYSKQLNNSTTTNNNNNKQNFKSCLYLNSQTNSNSVSMKNINEIQSCTNSSKSKNDYSLNLQMALKAATAALQKSKITASSNFIPISLNTTNTTNQQIQPQSQQQTFVSNQSKSNMNLSNKNLKNSNSSPSSTSSSCSNSSSTSSSSTSTSTQALSGSANSVLFNSNQSLFQPYSKLKEKKSISQRLSQSSTPISNNIIKTNNNQKLYKNTLVIETGSNTKLNTNIVSTSSQSSSTSASSCSSTSNNEKLDTSDYDNIENSGSFISSNNQFEKNISIKLNNINNKILKRQKSASTEYLCLANPTSKKILEMDEDSLNNYNQIKEFESNSSSNFKLCSNSPLLHPPPRIQPHSGVLSKSLFSLVLKPQPVKPVISDKKSYQNQSIVKESNVKLANHGFNFTSNNCKISFLKKKCVSTTNLVDSSSKNSSSPETKVETFYTNSSKSVTTLNSIKNDQISSSDNSINIDDDAADNYENDNENINVIIDSNLTSSNNSSKKINELEYELRLKTNEIDDLKSRLNLEIEKNRLTSSSKKLELEEEKQIYEQKLINLKAHFNQQLNLYEQNERQQMQDKLDKLQKIHNELKLTYKRNLENELKSLKSKLNESEMYAEQLFKQLQLAQTNNINKQNNKTLNTIGIQTIQTNNLNDKDVNNNNNNSNSELIYYLKKLKLENNELRLQIESERRRFQGEKEKWFLQYQNCIQQQQQQQQQQHLAKRNSIHVSNENLPSQMSNKVTANFKTNLLLNQVKLSQNQTNLNNSSLYKTQTQVNNSSLTNLNLTQSNSKSQSKQPIVKNVLVNHPHYL